MKKNILNFLSLIIFVAPLSLAQNIKYPNAQGGYDGIFILLTDNNTGSIDVERSESGSDTWVNIGTVKSTAASENFVTNFEIYSSRFPDLFRPKNSELETIWNKLQSSKSIDSLYFYGNSQVLRLALGLSFYDSTAERNKSYQYRILFSDNLNGRLNSEVTNKTSFPGKLDLEQPTGHFIRTKSGNIFIQWKVLPNEMLSSFLVFRQSNGRGDFYKINVNKGFTYTSDSVLFTISDKDVEQNNFYKYFVIPIDVFGNRGQESDTIFCGAYNYAEIALPINIKIDSIDSLSTLQLSWQIPDAQPVVNIEIFRSDYYDSGFVKIADISPQTIEYLDHNIEPMKKYFYYLQLVGPLNEISPTTARVFGFCQSNEKPIPPQNLNVESLPNGVKLQWENTEDFVDGFWVYRSNGVSDSLELISTLIKEEKPFTTYYDTTGLLGSSTYSYAIRSSSTSHILSNFSDTIFVRPDIKTKPPSPLELAVQMDTDSSAMLSWFDMTSIDNSIYGYSILRMTANQKDNSEFIQVTDSLLPFTQNSFVDFKINPGNNYEYKVISVDVYGGESDPSVVSFNYPLPRPIAIEGLSVTKSENGVELEWNEPLQKDIKGYKVFKQTRDTNPKLIGSVQVGSEMRIIDKDVSTGKLYFYYVTSVNDYGLESEPGKIVSVIP